MAEPKKSPNDPAGRLGASARAAAGEPDVTRIISSGAAADARIDERLPEESAREHPDGSAPALDRKTQYKNTDEAF